MRLLLAGILALGLWPVSALAQDEPPLPIARPAPEMRDIERDGELPPTPTPRPSVAFEPQTIAFPDGVSAQFDITYASLSGFRPLTLDIYTPKLSPVPLPFVLFVHGGGWNSGDSRHAQAFADLPSALAGLAAQGYIVASLNYRLSREAHFPAALQDVKAAIRWLRGRAGAYGGDATRVAVWGISAGGQLAAMAGTTCGVARFEPDANSGANASYDAPSDCAEAVIDWFGPTDLENLDADNGKPDQEGFVAASQASAAGSYLGCEPQACAPGVATLASPMAFISVNAPPFLIQHGAADTDVSPKQSQRLYDALKQKGVPAELVVYPDVGHGFAKNGSPDGATVSKAMAKLIAFLAATFPNKPEKNSIRHTVANRSPQP
jgi:acetyl esterase/lipase